MPDQLLEKRIKKAHNMCCRVQNLEPTLFSLASGVLSGLVYVNLSSWFLPFMHFQNQVLGAFHIKHPNTQQRPKSHTLQLLNVLQFIPIITNKAFSCIVTHYQKNNSQSPPETKLTSFCKSPLSYLFLLHILKHQCVYHPHMIYICVQIWVCVYILT